MLTNSSFTKTVFLAVVLFVNTPFSKKSKYTEGVAERMCRYIAIQRLSRKCVQKKYALPIPPNVTMTFLRKKKKKKKCTELGVINDKGRGQNLFLSPIIVQQKRFMN